MTGLTELTVWERNGQKGQNGQNKKLYVSIVSFVSLEVNWSACNSNKLTKIQWKLTKLTKLTVQIFIQAAKMEEEIFNLSKITKNESKIIFFDICKFPGINLPSKMQFYLCTKERSHPTCQQNVRLTTAHLSQFNQPVAVLFERVEAHKVVHSALWN